MKRTNTFRKLTALESRAWRSLEDMRTGGYGTYHFDVDWRKNRTWGACPSITTSHGKVAHASGCGYDKLSACLVDFLAFLFEPGSAEFFTIAKVSAAGLPAVQEALGALGFALTCKYSGRNVDAFMLERAPTT